MFFFIYACNVIKSNQTGVGYAEFQHCLIPSHISTLAFKTAWEYMDFGKLSFYRLFGDWFHAFSVISCSFAGYSLEGIG